MIENSNTEFSYEMRKLIRQKISSGLTNEEIKTELVKEFGEDILTDANQKTGRFFLWCLPVLFMVILPTTTTTSRRSTNNNSTKSSF